VTDALNATKAAVEEGIVPGNVSIKISWGGGVYADFLCYLLLLIPVASVFVLVIPDFLLRQYARESIFNCVCRWWCCSSLCIEGAR
jgi:hypothetical protein